MRGPFILSIPTNGYQFPKITEAHDFPDELFRKRVWHVARPVPETAALARAVEVIKNADRPLIVAGGGVTYSEAGAELDAFARATGIPVADTHAGKGAVSWDHPNSVGGVGSTGTPVANRLARGADVVIGVGTRYSDFTTASRTAFQHPGVRFVNVNVAAFDAAKESALPVVADARSGLTALLAALGDRAWETAASLKIQHLQDVSNEALSSLVLILFDVVPLCLYKLIPLIMKTTFGSSVLTAN